ncbi:MAG: hypothetical protein ACRENG_18865, partial [bacterium]
MSKIFTFISRPLGVILLLWQIILSFTVCRAQPRLKPNLDAAQFQDKAGQSYLEIYYSLPEAAIKYVPGANGAISCRLLLALQIYHDRQLWASKSWKIEKPLASAPELQNTQ